MLQSDLVRQGQDLALDTDLLYLDVANRRVGINNTTPNVELSVNGNVNAHYYYGIVATADQPFITNVGTIGNLNVSGNLTVGNISIDGATGNSISISGDIITTLGNLKANAGQVSGNTIVGNIFLANIISSNSAILTTANLGNLYFTNATISTVVPSGNITLDTTGNGIVIFDTTVGLGLPVGNTAQQITSVPVGSIRYNTDLNSPEYFDGSQWIAVTTSVSNQELTPNGSANAFGLTQTTTSGGVIVTLNGVIQSPVTAYSVTGNVITFTETPVTTDIIDIRYIAAGQSLGLYLGGTVPASSSSTGSKGQVAYDSSYVYICVAPNTWIRANAQATF